MFTVHFYLRRQLHFEILLDFIRMFRLFYKRYQDALIVWHQMQNRWIQFELWTCHSGLTLDCCLFELLIYYVGRFELIIVSFMGCHYCFSSMTFLFPTLTCYWRLQEHNSEEVPSKILHSFKKMSTAFVDPSKAVESFQNLHHSKDNNIFKTLLLLVGEDATFTTCQTIRVS